MRDASCVRCEERSRGRLRRCKECMLGCRATLLLATLLLGCCATPLLRLPPLLAVLPERLQCLLSCRAALLLCLAKRLLLLKCLLD